MSSTVSVRLPASIAQQLEELALETQRPKTFIIKKALQQYLEDYSDYQIALDRLHDKDDALLTPEEMRKQLGL